MPRVASATAVIVLLVVAALVVVSVTGCGSSGTATTGASTASVSTAPTAKTPSASDIEGDVLSRLSQVPTPTAAAAHPSSPNGTGGAAFLRTVFNDAQEMWRKEFAAAGVGYIPARMTIFRDQVHTACGTQSAQVGPFYCPADHGVYLDTRFFAALVRRTGVRLGDVAQAYVVAHEVAHHVQTLLGILPRVRAADQQDPAGANARSVRLELQADCLAGIWKHTSYHRGELTAKDLEDALRAAAVVGDDFQQRRATGTITPENWTHGSSAQRQHWLTVGFDQGRPAACDTFSAP